MIHQLKGHQSLCGTSALGDVVTAERPPTCPICKQILQKLRSAQEPKSEPESVAVTDTRVPPFIAKLVGTKGTDPPNIRMIGEVLIVEDAEQVRIGFRRDWLNEMATRGLDIEIYAYGEDGESVT